MIKILLLILSLLGCQHSKVRPLASWKRVQSQFSKGKLYASQLRKNSKFPFKVYKNFKIPIGPDRVIPCDFFAVQSKDPLPLVLIVHGNGFNKSMHETQGERLASWGFHTLTIELPNKHRWLKNGQDVYQLTTLLHSFPKLLSSQVDTNKIILIGHSFGGSAVSLATGMGAPNLGLILLDPAMVHPSIKNSLKSIYKPVIILGADKKVFKSRMRRAFYNFTKGPTLEVSVKGATHNDAQYPSYHEVKWGLDFTTASEKQENFLTGMIIGAYSLSQTRNIRLAYKYFKPLVKRGRLIRLHQKK